MSNPAKKILGFYRDLALQEKTTGEGHVEATQPHPSNNDGKTGHARYATANTVQRSKIFREMGPVTNEWMEKWTRTWFET